MTPDEQIAAIRERHEQNVAFSVECCQIAGLQGDHDPRFRAYPGAAGETIDALLARIDTLTAERNYLEQNETVVWEVLQLPDGSTIHDVAAAVFKLRQERDTLTAERDEAEANIGEVNQLLADTLSRTKSAEQRAEDAARGERDAVVAWLKQRADDQEDRGDDIAIRLSADAIQRGEHEQD